MGKEYTLPWSCDTHDKLINIIKYIGVLGIPLGFYFGPIFTPSNPGSFQFVGSALLVVVGILSTIWVLMAIDYPSFKCKTKSNDTSQKERMN